MRLGKVRKSKFWILALGIILSHLMILGFATSASATGLSWSDQSASSGTRDWIAISMSSDGVHRAAADWGATNAGGYIYVSNDSGATWTQSGSISAKWYSIASSSDGSKLVAVGNNTAIYTSTNFGASWTARDSVRSWRTVASSADGTKLIAGDGATGGAVYISTNSGANWSVAAGAGTGYWYTVATSPDGRNLTASEGISSGGSLWNSNDGGSTWVERDTTPPNLWRQAMATSADGSLIITAKFIANGEIFISRDYGATWETKTVAHTGNWRYFAVSSSGKRIVAAASGGYIHISDDFGNTWVEQTAAGSRNWIPVTMTGDGSVITGGAFGGTIWSVTSQATLSVGSISPNSGTTAGGTTITISGSGFAAGATVSVGGNACASVVVVSSTSITCRTPQGTASTKNVVVSNADGENVTSVSGFSYTASGVNPPSDQNTTDSENLAATGSDSASYLLAATASIAIGLVAVSYRRKRFGRLRTSAKHRA